MKRDLVCRWCAMASALLFAVVWFLDPVVSADETVQLLFKSTVTRAIGSLVFVFVLVYLGYRVFHAPKWTHAAAVLPALVIAVNNMPILGLMQGWVWVERWEWVWLFALDTFFIGLFEELAFRGVLFPFLLENRRGGRRQIFFTTVICSALFGLVHLVNLLEGAGFGATVLQVGYSFLIGGMCSIVLLKTGNLLYCILLHGIYDFGGGLIPTLGSGELWDTPTVVLTVILSVIVIVWMLLLLWRVTPEDADKFYQKRRTSNEHGEN
ncbi:MAG: CPBP family intramembrane metalloprotease [Ruminococcaceae bacterium]|nr:CPBP family intramembrane metalloprotease [Oscillospiraceae bacterium]